MRLNALLLVTGLLLATSSSAADVYDNAVTHADRSENDLKRDANDKPADVLRFPASNPGCTWPISWQPMVTSAK